MPICNTCGRVLIQGHCYLHGPAKTPAPTPEPAYQPGDHCRMLPGYRVEHAADCPDWAEGTITDTLTGMPVTVVA